MKVSVSRGSTRTETYNDTVNRGAIIRSMYATLPVLAMTWDEQHDMLHPVCMCVCNLDCPRLPLQRVGV